MAFGRFWLTSPILLNKKRVLFPCPLSKEYLMKIELLYGRGKLAVQVPDYVRVTSLRKRPMIPLRDPEQATLEALENPVGSPPLLEVARGKGNACILICDVTRPVPNGLLLPPLVNTLVRAGIPRERIRILVATGLHRPSEGVELKEVVGSKEIFGLLRIENHFARDREAHVHLGETSSGVPIMIDRRFAEADLKMVVGLVEPHFMAGYSGGRKLVVPGVAYADTILKLHSAHLLGHSKAANCVVQGNPLHEEQIQVVRALGSLLALNVVIDEDRRIGFVNFGEIEASHYRAVEFMRGHAEVSVPRRFKTIVTTSAGYPLDKTYYQTVKGMVGVIDIIEPGGTIITASACSEGMGSRDFVEAQRRLCRLGPDRFMSEIQGRDRAMVDEWQTQMLVKALRAGNIQLFTTGLGEADLKDIYIRPVTSVESAILQSVGAHGDPHIAVVPEGPYVIPLFKP
jgi:nickel-dependent lactate racemase